MTTLPPELQTAYRLILAEAGIPMPQRSYYIRWLSLYHTECRQHGLSPDAQASQAAFIARVRQRHPSAFLVEQARHALSLAGSLNPRNALPTPERLPVEAREPTAPPAGQVKRQLEEELKQRISSEVQKKESDEAKRKVEAVRQKSEDEARKKIQSDVLARVQAQQKEKLAPLQRTIEEIRRKVEEQQAQARPAAVAAKAAVPAPPAPEPEPADDDMDDFMTAAVADIYVKQGLVKEATRIYERILKREPGNQDAREDVLKRAAEIFGK